MASILACALLGGGARATTAADRAVAYRDDLPPTPIRVDLESLPEPGASESARRPPRVIPPPRDATLRVPFGFEVDVFAADLDEPRWLALAPTGEVLVTETRKKRIRWLRDEDGDGRADRIGVFADTTNGLNLPFGMAFAGSRFFLGNTDEVRVYPYDPEARRITGTGERIAALPGRGYRQHWTRNVVLGPKGRRLYVSVGSESNNDEEKLPRACVLGMNLDGTGQEVIAHGLRNPVGLAFHPQSSEIYVTVNERDGLGDDLVPDYFTRIRRGEFFGWPYAYLTKNRLDPRHIRNGRSVRPERVAETVTPDVLFQAHSAPLGLTFYRGRAFPERYRRGAYVAFRGSWNRSSGTGYKIVFIPFDAEHRPVGHYEDFVTGFLVEPSVPRTFGRPVGILELPDGSLLFTEEPNGRIYRVSYSGKSR